MKFALVLLALVFSFPGFSKTIDFQIKMEVFSESSEIFPRDLVSLGCDPRFVEDNVCLIEKVMDEQDLPFDLEIGEAYFSITREGRVQMGFSWGDHDQSTSGSLDLPTDENGNLFSLSSPLELNVSGGDHASGMWSFDGHLKIFVE